MGNLRNSLIYIKPLKSNILTLDNKFLSCINWRNKFHYPKKYLFSQYIQHQNLDYWLHYKNSMTSALATSNFKVELIFNNYIKNIWYRHVLIYVANKPFIYAISKTQNPSAFSLINLGNKSIGSQLFNKTIHKSAFNFAKANFLQTWLIKFNLISISYIPKNIIVRKRIFTNISNLASLELQEFFL